MKECPHCLARTGRYQPSIRRSREEHREIREIREEILSLIS
jgi:hypothetical protein